MRPIRFIVLNLLQRIYLFIHLFILVIIQLLNKDLPAIKINVVIPSQAAVTLAHGQLIS